MKEKRITGGPSVTPGSTGLCNPAFHKLWGSLEASTADIGNIKLAAFLLQHAFPREQMRGAARIGIPSDNEYLALSALVDQSAAYIVLGTEPNSTPYRAKLAELVLLAGALGQTSRAILADLLLPERWAHVLSALSAQPVGLLGLTADWALTDEHFWIHMQDFIEGTDCVVYIRDLLDPRHSNIAVDLLRRIPADCTVTPFAATPNSIWWCRRERAEELLHLLGSTQDFQCEVSSRGRYILADNSWASHLVNQMGRIARKTLITSNGTAGEIEFKKGWSDAESDGIWSQGPEAVARLLVPEFNLPVRQIVVRGNAWVPPDNMIQEVEIGVGSPPKQWQQIRFTGGSEIQETLLEVSPDDSRQRELLVSCRVKNPGRPSDYGESDTRSLGYKLRAVCLFT